MARKTKMQSEAEQAAIAARNDAIRQETIAFFEAVKRLGAPAVHQWSMSRGWDSWFCSDFEASCRGGISLMLRSTAVEWNEPDQLHAEIRIFRGAFEESSYRPERAIVWFERGSRMSGSPRIEHVTDSSAYVGCEGPTSVDLETDASTGRLTAVSRILPTHPIPMSARHVYADDWTTMSRHLLESIRVMLAKDAACVAEGRSIPEPYQNHRMAA